MRLWDAIDLTSVMRRLKKNENYKLITGTEAIAPATVYILSAGLAASARVTKDNHALVKTLDDRSLHMIGFVHMPLEGASIGAGHSTVVVGMHVPYGAQDMPTIVSGVGLSEFKRKLEINSAIEVLAAQEPVELPHALQTVLHARQSRRAAKLAL